MKVAKLRLFFKPTESPITKRHLTIYREGKVEAFDMGTTILELPCELAALKSLKFTTTVFDEHGREAISEAMEFTLGNLELTPPPPPEPELPALLADTELDYEIMDVIDVPDPAPVVTPEVPPVVVPEVAAVIPITTPVETAPPEAPAVKAA